MLNNDLGKARAGEGVGVAGRKRSELSGSGAQADLARRLRALRDESGLTLRQAAIKSGYSQAALSGAESGRRVPSWEVTEAFVQACGGSPQAWRQLWEFAASSGPDEQSEGETTAGQVGQGDEAGQVAQAGEVGQAGQDANAAAGQGGGSEGEDGPESEPEAPSPRRGPRPAVLVAAGAAACVAAALGGWALARGTNSSPPPTSASQTGNAAARDGTDPYDDSCKADEKELDWAPVNRADGTGFGTILLMYSPGCQAAWGYLNGPNATAWTSHIVAHRIPGSVTAPSEFNGNAAYGSWGNVLSTHSGCVYIEAFVTDSKGTDGPHARTACMQPGSAAPP